ncbi:plasmid mobilization relaxosome protein MobC, partial [Acinetobacter ursingii]
MTAIKRKKVYTVRCSDAEVQKIKDANILNIAKYLRDTALAQIDVTQGNAKKKNQEHHYTNLDRDFLLELSRIG